MKPLAMAVLFAAVAGYVLLAVGKEISWVAHVLVAFAWLVSLGVIYECRDGGRRSPDSGSSGVEVPGPKSRGQG